MRQRPENFVTFVPAANVVKIHEPSVVISIKGRYDNRPDINPKHTVFKMDFDVGDWAVEGGHGLKAEQIDELLVFLEANKGRDVYIHCTEGRIRSFTIAKLLRGDGLYNSIHLPITGPGGTLDRPTCNTWHERKERLEEAERAAEQS